MWQTDLTEARRDKIYNIDFRGEVNIAFYIINWALFEKFPCLLHITFRVGRNLKGERPSALNFHECFKIG